MRNVIKKNLLENKFIKLEALKDEKENEMIIIYAGKIQEEKGAGKRKIRILIFAVEVLLDDKVEILDFDIKTTDISAKEIKKFFIDYDIESNNMNQLLNEKMKEIKNISGKYIQYRKDCCSNLILRLDDETVVFEENPCSQEDYNEAIKYVLDNTEDENKDCTKKNGYVIVKKDDADKLIKKFLKSKNNKTSLAKFYRNLKTQEKIYANNGDSRVEYRVKENGMTGIAFKLEETNGKT